MNNAESSAEISRSKVEAEIMENTDLTEEQKQEMLETARTKQQEGSDSEVDEIEMMIERE